MSKNVTPNEPTEPETCMKHSSWSVRDSLDTTKRCIPSHVKHLLDTIFRHFCNTIYICTAPLAMVIGCTLAIVVSIGFLWYLVFPHLTNLIDNSISGFVTHITSAVTVPLCGLPVLSRLSHCHTKNVAIQSSVSASVHQFERALQEDRTPKLVFTMSQIVVNFHTNMTVLSTESPISLPHFYPIINDAITTRIELLDYNRKYEHVLHKNELKTVRLISTIQTAVEAEKKASLGNWALATFVPSRLPTARAHDGIASYFVQLAAQLDLLQDHINTIEETWTRINKSLTALEIDSGYQRTDIKLTQGLYMEVIGIPVFESHRDAKRALRYYDRLTAQVDEGKKITHLMSEQVQNIQRAVAWADQFLQIDNGKFWGEDDVDIQDTLSALHGCVAGTQMWKMAREGLVERGIYM